MPIINVTTLQDILGGTAPTDAIFTAYMMRSGTRAVRVQDDEVIFPAQVNVKFVDGVPEEQIELETPPADCYWSIRIKGPERVLLRTNVILPLGPGPFDFDELIEVIPETGLPDAGTALADAFLEAVQSATVGATGPTGPAADTGDITFDGVKVIGAGDASGDGFGYGTMELVPDSTRYQYDQYLVVDPTQPNHIHIRAGGRQGSSDAELIFGGEKTNVRIADYIGNVGVSAGLPDFYYQLEHEGASPSTYLVTTQENLPSVGAYVVIDESTWFVTEVTENIEVPGESWITVDSGEVAVFQPNTTYEFVEEQGSQYYWYFGNDGMFYGPGMGTVYVPAISSLGENADLYLSSPEGSVVLSGNTGEFIGTDEAPLNQIATLGDIGVETEYAVQGGTAGTQPTFSGDPLFTASYVLMSSNLVHFQIQVDMDNITNFGTGQYYMTLPFPSKYGYKFRDGCLHDANTGVTYHISAHVFAGSDQITLFTTDLAGQNLYDFPFTQGEPITLATADNFHIAGTYIREVAP